MELHRLKPMQDYDQEVFARIYKDTRSLVKTLVRGIDYSRFDVTQDIIESWFDDKLLYVFNKYYGKYDEGVLKGHVINALKLFRYRVLKSAYTEKAAFRQNTIDLGEDNERINIIPDRSEPDTRDALLNLMYEFMKENLSKDAYLVFELQADPPEYFTSRLSKPTSRIPAKLICQFCEIEPTKDAIRYIGHLREEIQENIKRARMHFANQALPV